MRLRRFLVLLALPPVIGVGASCAALSFSPNELGASTSGAGGAPFDDSSTGEGTSTGNGGSVGLTMSTGAGGGTVTETPSSYEYLCGGSHAACEPGAKTDNCAQGGNPGMGGSPAADGGAVSCQIVATPDGGTGITAQCGVSGAAGDGDPCMSAADCAPDLGCIAGLTPICRAYCCDSLESCPPETYCVTSPMHETPFSAIPVCIPAMTCELLNDATCPAGLTCAIVRASGTTSCVAPGTGTVGQGCPCAPGYTCSLADDTCLQLCHTGSAECGSDGFCQGGTKPYPDGIGYCVSY